MRVFRERVRRYQRSRISPIHVRLRRLLLGTFAVSQSQWAAPLTGFTIRMRIPILMYHALDERRSAISIPPAVFEWQMLALYEGGFQVIPLSRLVHCLRNGSSLPDKAVVITFDDGLESVYTSAFPILERFACPATIFLVADYCGKWSDWPSQPASAPRFPLMTWSQICEMDSHGIEFGGHTFSHPRLDQVPPEGLEHEIVESKSSIEGRLGHSIELFAYPYGRYNEASDSIVRQVYSGACTTRLALAGPESDPLALERVDAYYVQTPLLFRRLSSPMTSMYLSIRGRGRTRSPEVHQIHQLSQLFGSCSRCLWSGQPFG